MSFRRSVYLAILLAVVATVLLEVVLDVAVDRWVEAAEPEVSRLLLDLVDVPLAIGAAFVIAWILTRLLDRPLRRLTAAARDVAAERFTTRVELPPGDDELAQLARAFNAMAAAVQGHMERERALTRYASHELRTPLAVLRLQIERAELGHADDATLLPALKRQVARLEEVLAALLLLARAGEPEVGRRALPHLVDETLGALAAAERERVRLAAAVPELEVSQPRLLQQALANLVDNALRHGGGTATLTLEREGGTLTVRVRDAGPGVPEAELERLTLPFYRLADAGAGAPSAGDASSDGRSGSGLGLALVAFIARTLAGSLELGNAGPGLEAVLKLPILVPADASGAPLPG